MTPEEMTVEWWVIMFLILGFCIIVLAAFQAWRERLIWNNGICPDNGLPWQQFDTDSQGGRGYKAGDKYCWISWPVDRGRQ